MCKRFYVTTAIPYVNGAPHLGHALEFVQADTLARHRRLRGDHVRFLSGTDDHAGKNVTAARAAGVDVAKFVDRHADAFAALREPLDLSYDDFIRTSVDPRHRIGVEALWHQSVAAGDFYRDSYTGRYCEGCEQFQDEVDLVEGRWPEHRSEPTRIVEDNWFFRLSRYQDAILDAVENGTVRIEPTVRRNEVLAFVRAGLRDFSVSRPADRSGGWGIGVPGDPSQVIYVWWDALANYLTALGYGAADGPYRTWWLSEGEQVHVIGKGILRFHAVYWLGLLLSAGQPLPTTIFVHDYLTVDSTKIAKSAGTQVSPAELVDQFGADALRWWLLSDVARIGETDFSTQRLIDSHDRDLANGLGNLVNRTITLVTRFRDGRVPSTGDRSTDLRAVANALPGKVDHALDRFDLRAATAAIREVVAAGNRTVESERPWELAKSAGRKEQDQLDAVLVDLVHTCRVLARELEPFLPAAAARIQDHLGAGDRLEPGPVIFPRLRT